MPKLYPKDQDKVNQYLARENQGEGERKAFNPGLLLLLVICVLGVLTAVSYWVAIDHGVVWSAIALYLFVDPDPTHRLTKIIRY